MSRPAERGKKRATAGETLAGGESGEDGRGVDPGRGTSGTQADRPSGVVDPRATAALVRPDEVRVAVCVRLRATGDGADVHAPAPAGEGRTDGEGSVRVRGPRRCGRDEGSGAGGGQRGWHRAKALVVPRNVRLHFLPPCTPELQPIEAFWPLVREAVANDTFDRLSDLRRRITRRWGWLARNPDVVKAAVGFHWAVKLET